MFEIPANEAWTPFLEEVNDLMLEEKQARHDNDHVKVSEICLRILRLAFDHHDLPHLRDFMAQLIKRRGQAKKAIIDMVQWVMSDAVLNKLPSREERYKMLDALKEASEGKMFLEREYSQVTRTTAEMLEADGKHDDATKLVQEIQIETYGSLQTVEKVDFILYQMKLVLGRRDFVRCQILSRKISKKHINEKGLER
jgi:26S proteasome regulatory subunit N5